MVSIDGWTRNIPTGMWRLGRITGLILVAGAALAATVEADSGIGVAPSIVEVAATAPGQAAQQLIVFNQSAEIHDVVIAVGRYKDAAGDRSAVDWLKASPESFQLGPRERREVTVQIAVPDGLQPGGRYASVLVRHGGASHEDELAVSFLVAVGPPQELTRRATVEQARLLIEPDGRTSFRALLVNQGNRHLASRGGEVTITRRDGMVAGKLQIPENAVVVPGASEQVTALGLVRWQEDAQYLVRASVDYGSGKPAIVENDLAARTALSITRLGVLETQRPQLQLDLRNDGTLGLAPLIRLDIRDADGSVVSTVHPPHSSLWPGTSGAIAADVPNDLSAGSYTLRAHVAYGAGKSLERSARFQVGMPSEGRPINVRLATAPDPVSQRFALGLMVVFVLVLFGSRVPALAVMWRRSMRAVGVLRAE